ncbi:MAG: response regulator [Candidatus Eremiobacteraeota bacterium]|nr:response regulator [Candidatus Eremiobacteraeota bacterium]
MARVLVLEDDPDMRETLVECLEDLDHRVFEAGSGEEAVEMGTKQALDLVVADVRMKNRDGIETVRILRNTQPQMKAIIITGYASDDAPGRAIEVGAEDYLYKPFKLVELKRAVARVLSQQDDQSAYQKIVGSFRAGFARLKERATNLMLDREMAGLDSTRSRAFKGFYVAVRSELLPAAQARVVWQQLDGLDRRREQLKAEENPTEPLQELGEQYKYLGDLLAAVGRSSSVMPRLKGETELSEANFAFFFANVRSGAISSEQLKLAPFLYHLDPALRAQSEELQRLYDMTWGR